MFRKVLLFDYIAIQSHYKVACPFVYPKLQLFPVDSSKQVARYPLELNHVLPICPQLMYGHFDKFRLDYALPSLSSDTTVDAFI